MRGLSSARTVRLPRPLTPTLSRREREKRRLRRVGEHVPGEERACRQRARGAFADGRRNLRRGDARAGALDRDIRFGHDLADPQRPREHEALAADLADVALDIQHALARRTAHGVGIADHSDVLRELFRVGAGRVIGARRGAVVREVFLDDARATRGRHGAAVHLGRVIRVPDGNVEPTRHLADPAEIRLIGRGRVAADAVEQREVRVPLAQPPHRFGDFVHGRRAAGDEHRPARVGDALEQHAVYEVRRRNFHRGQVERLDRLDVGGRERRRQRDHAEVTDRADNLAQRVLAQLVFSQHGRGVGVVAAVLLVGREAARGVHERAGGEDLKLHRVGAARTRDADELERANERTIVVHADLGDHERRPARADLSAADVNRFHDAILRCVCSLVSAARSRSTASAQYRSRKWSISIVSPIFVSMPRRFLPKNACGSPGFASPSSMALRVTATTAPSWRKSGSKSWRRWMLPGCSASTSPSLRRDIHAGCHLPTGVKVRTESQPLVRSSVSARSIMSSPRSGTLPYRTTSASNCTPLPASTVFMAWSIAPCTDASAVASSGGRAIVWMPALAAARRTFGQSLETTTSVSAREPRAWSNVYSITARPSSGSMCLFARPRLPARARMTPSAFIKSPLRPMPFVAALTHGEAQPLPGAMVLSHRADALAPDLRNRRASDFAERLLSRYVLLARDDSAIGQDRH